MEAMEVTAQQLVAGGDALARLPSGKVIFVEGALPGEEVRVQLTDTRKDFGRATVEEVLSASPDRRDPPCPHVADGCGGWVAGIGLDFRPLLQRSSLARGHDAVFYRSCGHQPCCDVAAQRTRGADPGGHFDRLRDTHHDLADRQLDTLDCRRSRSDGHRGQEDGGIRCGRD